LQDNLPLSGSSTCKYRVSIYPSLSILSLLLWLLPLLGLIRDFLPGLVNYRLSTGDWFSSFLGFFKGDFLIGEGLYFGDFFELDNPLYSLVYCKIENESEHTSFDTSKESRTNISLITFYRSVSDSASASFVLTNSFWV
jgi:hypothetical protein